MRTMISYMQLCKSETLILSTIKISMMQEDEIPRERVNNFDCAFEQMIMCGYNFQGHCSDDVKLRCCAIELL